MTPGPQGYPCHLILAHNRASLQGSSGPCVPHRPCSTPATSGHHLTYSPSTFKSRTASRSHLILLPPSHSFEGLYLHLCASSFHRPGPRLHIIDIHDTIAATVRSTREVLRSRCACPLFILACCHSPPLRRLPHRLQSGWHLWGSCGFCSCPLSPTSKFTAACSITEAPAFIEPVLQRIILVTPASLPCSRDAILHSADGDGLRRVIAWHLALTAGVFALTLNTTLRATGSELV